MNNPAHSAQCLRTLYLAILSCVLAACGVIDIGIEPTPSPVTVTPEPPPTELPRVEPTSDQATPAVPRFTTLSFALSPDSPQAESVFPPGTDLVYARWSYKNMVQGARVMAKVYRGAESLPQFEEWSLPERAWDLPKYGAEGEITDFEIHGPGSELDYGHYVIQLYVDGGLETVGSFDVARAEEAVSPDGTRTAIVMNLGTLLIREESREDRQILVTDEISSLAWFPDGDHIVFSDRDRSGQLWPTTMGREDELWIIDVLTGETSQLAALDENLHDPVVSPEGHYIALIAGDGSWDASHLLFHLQILQVDAQLQRVASFGLADFPDLASFESESYSWLGWEPDLPSPGIWEQEGVLRSALIWGAADPQASGIYRLDLKAMRAEKIGELTEE